MSRQERSNEGHTGSRTDRPRWPVVSWLLVGIAAAAFLAGGGYWLASRPAATAVEVVIPTPTAVPPVLAHLVGAVRTPGVYTLPAGSRVEAAINAAGGAAVGADVNALNLAETVADGARIEVPTAVPGQQSAPAASTVGAEASSPGLIDLNLAAADELESLPGIGEVRARAIVDWRNRNGPFGTVEGVLEVPGIGETTLENIRDLVTAR
jgi:competence protein ComEA